MSGRRSYGIAVLVAAVLVAAAVAVSGQAQRGPATLDDLLTELQGLRADLVQSSSASVRVQTLTARLSLQEQRLMTLGRQLAEQQTRLDAATEKRRQEEDGVKQWEAALSNAAITPEIRRDMETSLPGRKADVSRLQANEQQIRSQVSEISNLIASEQNYWTEFSNRLSDIERSLPSR